MAQGTVRIDKEMCKGCEYCVVYCHPGCLKMSSDFNQAGYHYPILTESEKCMGCPDCALVCPDMAIEVYQEEIRRS